MDLQGLKWTKNVRRGDGAWAYSQFKVSDLFKRACPLLDNVGMMMAV
jgi:hypothetical protein